MLCETRWAFTGETSQGVDTEELAIVLFGLTFVEVWNEREALANQSSVIWLRIFCHGATGDVYFSTGNILSLFLLEAL